MVLDPGFCLNEPDGIAFTDTQRKIEMDGNAVGCRSSCSSTVESHFSTGAGNPNIEKP